MNDSKLYPECAMKQAKIDEAIIDVTEPNFKFRYFSRYRSVHMSCPWHIDEYNMYLRAYLAGVIEKNDEGIRECEQCLDRLGGVSNWNFQFGALITQ